MNQTEPTTKISAAEWRAKATQLGNGNILDCRLQCMSCGTIFTPRQFLAAGGEANRATQHCIGRAGTPPEKLPTRPGKRRRIAERLRNPGVKPQPCNWSTYGLIALDGLVTVVYEDGKEMLVWPFADEYQPRA